MKYLVTGGTGFLGRSLVRALLSQGHQVHVYDNDSRGSRAKFKKDLMNPRLTFIQADIRDEACVAEACKGVDSVVHLSYINGTEFFYTQPDLVLDVGVRGMLAVIAGCQKAGVRDLLTVSSSEVYQTPPRIPTDEEVPLVVPNVHNPRYSYGGGKIISELLTINFGRQYFDRAMIVRPHNVYGPDMGEEHVIPQLALRLIEMMHIDENKKRILAGKPLDFLIQGSGEQTRAFVYIDDFTDGLLKVLQQGKHLDIYHIGTMHEMTIRDIVFTIADALQVKINLKYSKTPWGSVERRCPDITKLKTLGYAPKISIQTGIKLTTHWYYEQYRIAREEKITL